MVNNFKKSQPITTNVSKVKGYKSKSVKSVGKRFLEKVKKQTGKYGTLVMPTLKHNSQVHIPTEHKRRNRHKVHSRHRWPSCKPQVAKIC